MSHAFGLIGQVLLDYFVDSTLTSDEFLIELIAIESLVFAYLGRCGILVDFFAC